MRFQLRLLGFVVFLLLTLSFCQAKNVTVTVIGSIHCTDCVSHEFSNSQAYPGIDIFISCKSKNTETKTHGNSAIDRQGKFNVTLSSEITEDIQGCFAKLQSGGAGAPCPLKSAQTASVELLSTRQTTYNTPTIIEFSPVTCQSAFFWPLPNFTFFPTSPPPMEYAPPPPEALPPVQTPLPPASEPPYLPQVRSLPPPAPEIALPPPTPAPPPTFQSPQNAPNPTNKNPPPPPLPINKPPPPLQTPIPPTPQFQHAIPPIPPKKHKKSHIITPIASPTQVLSPPPLSITLPPSPPPLSKHENSTPPPSPRKSTPPSFIPRAPPVPRLPPNPPGSKKVFYVTKIETQTTTFCLAFLFLIHIFFLWNQYGHGLSFLHLRINLILLNVIVLCKRLFF